MSFGGGDVILSGGRIELQRRFTFNVWPPIYRIFWNGEKMFYIWGSGDACGF